MLNIFTILEKKNVKTTNTQDRNNEYFIFKINDFDLKFSDIFYFDRCIIKYT